ncbi:hypothetical protein K3495_g13203 [Podosphaera aphanis]|nr:hypothetical protein K3495_g13203 [Podosphaera aphanis]
MELLSLAQLALNARPNSAIDGISPFYLRNGYNLEPLGEPIMQIDNFSRHPGIISAQGYVRRLRDAQDFTQAAMASAQQRSERNANRLRRQPERFQVGDIHAKYEVTAVPDAFTVELNVPGNIHKRLHVELIKRAGNDPFPNQVRDDAQNPPVIDDLEDSEYEIDSIPRARTVRRGRGTYRQALVKWVGWVDPTWEPIEYIMETKALEDFESRYGPISTNDGSTAEIAGKYFGPAESQTKQRRQKRRAV